ncbi:MAG: peptidase C14 [Spirulina sp. SIO3F2]|nr:peptidase C14 [Spirulina sp. SIO3F2]
MSRDALVVGISHYTKSPDLCLDSPVHDARAIADILEQQGGFRVKRLLATDAQHPVNQQILSTQLKKLFNPGSKQVPDTALFYFSGHGFEVDELVKEVCLATSDTGLSTRGSGIRLQSLRKLLITSPVKQQLVWLDCCHSGAILNFQEGNPGDEGEVRDRCFIAASREFEVAYGGRGRNYSVLTQALLRGLQQPGSDALNSTDLLSFLRRELADAPQKLMFQESGGGIELVSRSALAHSDAANPNTNFCPYKGLEFFTEADAPYFAGRQALTDELLNKLRENQFVVLVGASGSGKSSVLRAGLLYEVRRGLRLSGSDQWQICGPIVPGERPFENLAAVLVNLDAEQDQRTTQRLRIQQQLQGDDTAAWLATWVEESAAPQVVLVLDQFEEIFTGLGEPGQKGYDQRKDTQRAFLACVLGALVKTPKLKVIVAMRADFFGKCIEEDYSGLAVRMKAGWVPVQVPTAAELAAAITEPAQWAELEVEPLLVKTLVADVAKAPGSLPLLQFTLKALWQAREGNRLTLAAYQGSDGLMGMLDQRATAVYEQFDADEQRTVRHIFQQLTQLGEGVEDTRRRVLVSNLVAEPLHSAVRVERVLQVLANPKNRLLVLSGKGENAIVDVVHEALIRHWGLLRGWVDTNRDLLRRQRRIEASAVRWQEQAEAKGYLLQGFQLKEAMRFEKKNRETFPLSDVAKGLVRRSVRQRWRSRIKVAIWLFILPIFVVGLVEDSVRNNKLYEARKLVYDATHQDGKHNAIKDLVKGCKKIKEYNWFSKYLKYLSDRIFGNCVDLVNAPLNGANLEGIDDLQGVNLSGAELQEANLQGINFSGANLSGAELQGANLSLARFDDADLSLAELNGAILGKTKLSGANLSLAEFDEAILLAIDLRETENLPELLNEESRPLFCNVALPPKIKPQDDCDEVKQALVDEGKYKSSVAQDMVNDALQIELD